MNSSNIPSSTVVESSNLYAVFMETTGKSRKDVYPLCLICHYGISDSDQTVVHYDSDMRTPSTIHESCLIRHMESGQNRCPCCSRYILTLLSLPNIPFITRLELPHNTITKVIQSLGNDWEQYYSKLKSKDLGASHLGISFVIRHGQKVEACLAPYEQEYASEALKIDQAIARISQEIDDYALRFGILCNLGSGLRRRLVSEGNGKEVGRARLVRNEKPSMITNLISELMIGNRIYEDKKRREINEPKFEDKHRCERTNSDLDFITRRQTTNLAWIQSYCQRSKAMLERNKQTHLQTIAQKYQDEMDTLWLDLCDTHLANGKSWKWPKDPPPKGQKLSWSSLRRWAISKRIEITDQAARNPFPYSSYYQEGMTMLYGSRSLTDAADDAVLHGSDPRGKERFHEVQRITERRLARLGFKYL